VPHARDPDPSAEEHEAREPRHSGSVRPRPPSRARLEAAVCEAVLRYQLHQPLVDPPHPPRYYVALRGRDPKTTLLRRLRAIMPRVQPLSQCRVTAREGVLDRTTGARGVIVQVARLAWVHAAAVDVVGGYYITHRHAASFRYHVVHDGRKWAVTAAHLLWRV
jgi:hypothetical protein